MILFISVLLLLQSVTINAIDRQYQIEVPSPNVYVPSNDIWIVSEQDIINYAFPGSGTINNPYLINGNTIDTTFSGATPITIKYTSVYIRVSNNILVSTGSNRAGILLVNTSNVAIVNNDISIAETSSYLDAYAIGIYGSSNSNYIADNYIHDGDDGVVIQGVSGDTFAPYSNYVYNNTFVDLTLSGVWLGGSSTNTIMRNNSIVMNNFTRISTGVLINSNVASSGQNDLEIKNNRFLGNNYGMNIAGSGSEATYPNINKNITIVNNTIIASWTVGMYISRHHYDSIINNTIIDGKDVGLQLRDTDYNNVTGNVIFNNAKHGIWLDGASNYNNVSKNLIANTSSPNNYGIYDVAGRFNQITFNTIANNTGYGLYFFNLASDNNVSSNDFINNYPSGTVQVFAQYNVNTFKYNYWSEWTTPDVDSNGIVDQPYIIYASANVQDPFPIVNSHSSGITIVPHSLSGLKVIAPNGGETLIGGVNISWDPAIDTKQHSITYSVYYYDGLVWTSLISNTSTISFMWDSTQTINGSVYMIKIVASDGNGMSVEDISDTSFTIDNPPPHTFSGLQVSFPNGGEVLKGMVNVTWIVAVDSLVHIITYSIYYSSDSVSWNLLGNSTTLSYLWNSNSVGNGSYFVKVIASDGNGMTIEDTSDASFTIANSINTTSTTNTSTSTSSTPTSASTSKSVSAPPNTSTSSTTTKTSSSNTGSTPLNIVYFVISILGISLINLKRSQRK